MGAQPPTSWRQSAAVTAEQREAVTKARVVSLFIAEDANFKQKAQLRSDTDKDPPLGPGWGTFVENQPYLRYVSQFADQDEVRLSRWNFLCDFGTNNNVLRFHIVRAFKRCQEPTISNRKACGPLV